MKKAKIFYHGSDMDGYASGYIGKTYIQNKYPDYEIEMIPLTYNDRNIKVSDIEDLDEGDIAIISDWSFNLDPESIKVPTAIANSKANIIWCDHHTTSLKLVEQYPKFNNISGIRSDKFSGAYLLYIHLYGDSYIPKWIQLVSDYDTFTLKMDNSIVFNYGVINSGRHDPRYNSNIFYDLDMTDKVSKSTLNRVISHGRTIYNYIKADNRRNLANNGFTCDIEYDGQLYSCIACNKMSNSLLFDTITEPYTFKCVFVFNGEYYKYTLYSSVYDCSKIAAKYNGGGHKGAAGFISDKLIFKNMKRLNNFN